MEPKKEGRKTELLTKNLSTKEGKKAEPKNEQTGWSPKRGKKNKTL